MNKRIVYLFSFFFGVVTFFTFGSISSVRAAPYVVSLCGQNSDGSTKTGPGCLTCNSWGSGGTCRDPNNGPNVYMNGYTCSSDNPSDPYRCQGAGASNTGHWQDGQTVDIGSLIGSACKYQLDIFDDNSLLDFMVFKNPDNCTAPPPPSTAKYRCDGNSCIRDDAGGSTTDSNCAGACAPPPPSTCSNTEAIARVNGGSWTASNLALKYGDQLCFQPNPISPNRTSSLNRSGDGWTGSTCSSAPGSPSACPNCITWDPWYGPVGSVSQHIAFDATGLLWWQAPEDSTCKDVQYITTIACDPNSWGTCAASCTQINACGTTRDCTGGACCTNTTPTGLTLTSPTDGAIISGTTADLSWSLDAWGTICNNTTQYQIYVDDVIVSTQTTSSLTGNYSYSGTSGTHTWKVRATNGTLSIVTDPRIFTLQNALPWWQVSGGGVTAAGSVTSKVASGNVFITDPAGMAVSGSGNTDFNGQPVSSTNWLVANTDSDLSAAVAANNSWTNLNTTVDGLVTPTNVSSSITSIAQLTPAAGLVDGVYYVQINGNADLAATGPLDVGDAKIVLFVTGNANIKNRINLNDNTGFFMLAAQGDITIDGPVGTSSYQTTSPDLEGIYFAQSTFNTGNSTNYLRIEGIVVGMNGVNNQRQIYSANPAETYVFRPEMAVLAPAGIMRKQRTWEEVAP